MPNPTYEVLTCQVCHTHREVKGPSDKQGGCPFCGTPARGQTVSTEKPDFSGVQVGRK